MDIQLAVFVEGELDDLTSKDMCCLGTGRHTERDDLPNLKLYIVFNRYYPPYPSQELGNIRPGVYLHADGGKYRVLGACYFAKQKEWLIAYIPLYEATSSLYFRPASMFFGKKSYRQPGREKPKLKRRFRFLRAN